MYEQTLVKTVTPVKPNVIKRLNRYNKWLYGYNKEHDIVVISKTGKIGEIIELQGLCIIWLFRSPFVLLAVKL